MSVISSLNEEFGIVASQGFGITDQTFEVGGIGAEASVEVSTPAAGLSSGPGFGGIGGS